MIDYYCPGCSEKLYFQDEEWNRCVNSECLYVTEMSFHDGKVLFWDIYIKNKKYIIESDLNHNKTKLYKSGRDAIIEINQYFDISSFSKDDLNNLENKLLRLLTFV